MDEKQNSISVIGCGWLGLPLGQKLHEQGWTVRGSTTTSDKLKKLRSAGIEGFVAQFPNKESVDPSLFQSKNLLINLPPGRSNPDTVQDYPQAVDQILKSAVKEQVVSKIIFISSTSVYGNSADLIDEQTEAIPETNSGKSILKAEELIKKTGIPYVILRFGGLAGPHRHPGRFLAGRKGLEIGSQSVNFLHLEDAAGVIAYFLTHSANNEIYNVVSPIHPNKSSFYIRMAESGGFELPSFSEPKQSMKRKEISADKLLKETSYTFIYPDPMHFNF